MRTSVITPFFRVGFRLLAGRSLSLGLLLGLAILPAARGQLYTETGLLTPAPGSYFISARNVAASGNTIAVGDREPSSQQASYNLAYIFMRDASGWTRQQVLQVPPYTDIALDGDTLVAGGAIYVRAGGSWTQQGSVPVTDVSETALQGDTLVVGTPYFSTNGAWNTDGAVHIYHRSGATWTEQATLTRLPGNLHEEFGEQVALDGDTLLVGTGLDRSPGTVYVYARSGTTWTEQGTLNFPDAMGEDLDLAIEGDTAVVSDRRHQRFGIFTRTGSTWSLTQTVVYEHENGTYNDYFFSMKLSLQNGILAVGVDGRNKAYLYKRTSAGWLLAQTIALPGESRPTLFDGGRSLALAGSSAGVKLYGQPPPPAPGSGWRDYDIGAVGAAGSSSTDGTTVTVRGSGPDVWDRADQFHLRSETLTGDGAIVARVTSAGGPEAWAKAGLMARADITAGAPEVMTFATPGGHLGAQARPTMGDFTSAQNDSWAGAPIWLMLARTGNEFVSYRSDDGDNWTPLATTTVTMPATIHVGLAVSSHDAGATLSTGTFTNVEIVATPPPGGSGAPAAPTGLAVGSPTDTTLHLTWTDASANETGFELQRATGSGSFVALPPLAANTTSFTDTGLTAHTTYSYRIRALAATNSGFSNVATASTADGGQLPSGWSGSDVGSPAIAGSETGQVPAFTMHAAGTDIYGTADSFRYLYETVDGDATVVARVVSLTNTNSWAKAGVMIRSSLGAGAVNAAMVLSPAQVCSFQARTTAGAATDVVTGPWVTPTYWVKLTRVGDTLTGYVSPDGATWTQVGSRTVVMPHQIYIGFAGCSHNTGTATTAAFDHADVSSSAPPPPPSVWSQQSWSATGSSFVMTSESVGPDSLTTTSGDIYGTADSGVFVSRQTNGDLTMISRCDAMTNTDSWAKAGLMFRASLDPAAANAFVALTPGVGAVFQSRAALAGSSTNTVGHNWVPGPGTWLKLVRGGGTISAAFSVDNGATWTSLGSITDDLPANIYVGWAAASHNAGASLTANFSRP